MALIAVILISTGVLVFSLATMSAAVSYSDVVSRKEIRIQAQLNAEACLDTAILMAAKDYFISGNIPIKEFGCEADFENDFEGNITISIYAKLGDISIREKRILKIGGNAIEVVA